MDSPIITSYPRNANFIAALSRQHPYYEDWLFMNHIQLALNIDKKNNLWVYFYEPLSRQYHPLFNKQEITKDNIIDQKIELCSFLTANLDKNAYIYLDVDTFYISAYSYGKKHLAHDLFIYGYSATKKVFYVADFFNEGRYSFSSVTFKELENAFYSNYAESNHEFNSLQLLSLNWEKEYLFDVSYFIKLTSDYLDSIKTTDSYRLVDSQPIDHTFGMHIYDKLLEYSVETASSMEMLKAFHVISDHKKLMLKRIDFLFERKIINNMNLYPLFDEIHQISLKMRNSHLKSLISGKPVKSQSQFFKELKDKENFALLSLIENIKKQSANRVGILS
ncbi:hypothetical protein ACX12E_18480 [Paenibacillus vandeheii]